MKASHARRRARRLTPFQAAEKVGLVGCVAGPRDLAENRRKYLRTARETTHLTTSKANVRRLRSAHVEIETEIARRRRKTT